MTGILIDTYAWIEIFRDSPWGRKAVACIEKSSSCFVSVLTLYKLQYRRAISMVKKKPQPFLPPSPPIPKSFP